MHQLDLVISVDTGTCHLAAAMNIPTWIILPFPADWRWLLDRTDSPWYPSVKLFRQTKPMEWEPAIASIVQEVKKLIPAAMTSHHDKPTKEQLLFFKKISTR
jgi:ADP-heptose:LPS heptosyltransferase